MTTAALRRPTLRKLRTRGLVPIRYHDGSGYRHGWIVREGARGTMIVHLVGDERNRCLNRNEVRYVNTLAEGAPS